MWAFFMSVLFCYLFATLGLILPLLAEYLTSPKPKNYGAVAWLFCLKTSAPLIKEVCKREG
jgi:hypothetical protein